MTIDEIASSLISDIGLTFSNSEIEAIVNNHEHFVLQQIDHDKFHDKYILTTKRYLYLSEKSNENIDECIKLYLQEQNGINNKEKELALKTLLEDYLYSMMNSNIDAYKQVLNGKIIQKGKSKNGQVNSDEFTESQIQEINGFLSWNNSYKDKELFKLISCCIEYAIVTNNTNEQALLHSFKNKILYIDNAFIYRAIGINGESRKKRTISFINKCNESGQKLKISKFSREEFIQTIDHNIRQLSKTTPFGRINASLFQKYCYGETLYQFYHNWRANRVSYGFNSFKAYVMSEYNNLIRNYGIEEDFRPPYNEHNDVDIKIIDKYSNEIEDIKKNGHKDSHDTDAKNMYWIECARSGVDGRLVDTKYYFITPDQKLQIWDSQHSTNQPITLLPSQWLALLLKYTSRSNDDYKSFVSFLRLPYNDTVISPEDLQEVLSGISEVTEDLKKQSDYLDVYMEEEWRQMLIGSIKGNLREEAKHFAKDQQEKIFEHELDIKSQEMTEALAKQEELSRIQISIIEDSFKTQLKQQERKSEENRLRMKIDYITQALNLAQRQLVNTSIRKSNADHEIDRIIACIKTKIIIGIALVVSVWIMLIIIIGWDKMELYTYIIGLLTVLLSILYLIIFEKKFSYRSFLNNCRIKKKRFIYSKHNVTDECIKECTYEIEKMKTELLSMEKALKTVIKES